MKICVARPSLPTMPRWKLEFAKATPLTTDHLSMARRVNCVGIVDRGTKMVLFRAPERNQGKSGDDLSNAQVDYPAERPAVGPDPL
jgi:hypothetical protein